MKSCPDCNGDGVIEKGTDDERRCPTCGGTGFVPDEDEDEDEDEEVIRSASWWPIRALMSTRPSTTLADIAADVGAVAARDCERMFGNAKRCREAIRKANMSQINIARTAVQTGRV